MATVEHGGCYYGAFVGFHTGACPYTVISQPSGRKNEVKIKVKSKFIKRHKKTTNYTSTETEVLAMLRINELPVLLRVL